MNPRIVIPVILALALLTGLFQWSRLAEVKQDRVALEASGSKLSPRASSHRGESLSDPMARRTTRESDPAAFAHMEAIMAISERSYAIAETWRNPATRTPEVTAALIDSAKNERVAMWPHFAALNHFQVLELIGRLQDSPRVPDMDKSNISQVCVERLLETNAGEALQLILKLEDLPERGRFLTEAFSCLSAENPGEAVRWFDEQSKKGEPVTRTPEMLEAMMLAEARFDPARAVAGFLSSAAMAPDSIALLGSKLASDLRDAGEHQALLAALRREGDSPVLAKIRSQYVASLARDMRGWPVEAATGLMDSEFVTGEKTTAAKVISPGGLVEADRWATWFSKINVPADDEHPLVHFVGSWVQSDPAAAGAWLDQASPGEVRNRAIVQYATLGADIGPAHAAGLLVTLPASADRGRLLERVLAHWKAEDRPAAAAFAKKHDLSE